jgi:hypothetical protein
MRVLRNAIRYSHMAGKKSQTRARENLRALRQTGIPGKAA